MRDETSAVVRGRRAEHIRKILKLRVGETLRAGRVDGPLGRATVTKLDRGACEVEVVWDASVDVPRPCPVTLAFAMPRPPTLSKVLQQATALGVKRFWIFGANRVEKSYWGATGASDAAMHEDLRLGLEQARDTVMPKVERFAYFRPFVEEHLAQQSSPIWVGDLEASRDCPGPSRDARVLVIGPEGGFVDFERACFDAVGAKRFSLGPRVLRVETATVALLARLSP